MINSEFYLYIGINEIPWDRMIHWYGRASNFPKLLKNLLSDNLDVQQVSINEIKNKLEHQGSIIMATPFTLLFLFRILTIEKTKIEKIANDILETIFVCIEAAKLQQEIYYKHPIETDIRFIQELLSEKYLWEEYESEEQDEIKWEEYDYSKEEYYNWLGFTLDIARFYSHIIEPFCTNKFYAGIARKIITISNPPTNYI